MAEQHRANTDQIIDWLQKHRAEIDGIPFGCVSFDLYGPGEVKARVERVEKLERADKLSA